MDEDEDESFKTGCILATVRHREPVRQSKDWFVVHVWVDKCSDEHVCSPRDFEWVATEPNKNPHLVSASGHKLKHYGEQAVPMKLLDGCNIWIQTQARSVHGPIMSLGQFCAEGNDRCATFTTRGRNAMLDETRNLLTPVQVGGSSGSASELAAHRATVPQRADAEILMDVQTHQELTKNTLNLRSFRLHRYEPNMDEIDAARPCDAVVRHIHPVRDDFHKQATPKILPVIQFDYAVAGAPQGQPHLDFMVGTDMNTGAAWA